MHTPRHAKAMCNGSDAEVHKQPVALDQTMRRDNFIISYCFMSSAHGFQLNHLLCVNGIIFHWILSGEVPLIKVNLIRCAKWNARGRFEIAGRQHCDSSGSEQRRNPREFKLDQWLAYCQNGSFFVKL